MIQINDSDTFTKLISELSSDIVNAQIHWRLHADLVKALEARPIVGQQSNTFWHLTLQAHANSAITHLCRAFDQNSDALHLFSWLKTIKANLHIFAIPAFKSRLADNPFVNSLASTARNPDPVTLDADILDCSNADGLVKKLTIYRAHYLAHRSADLATGAKTIAQANQLSDAVFETLLLRAITILNRYSGLFAAEIWSTSVIGGNDFDFIFRSVAEAVETSRAKSEAFLAAHSGDQPTD